MADEAAMEVESTRAPSERAASVAASPSASTIALPMDSGPAKPPIRPKIDLTTERGKVLSAGKEPRKRAGRTMFGVVLGTLNKAKSEDKARAASDAAKKRALIDQRLQSKIARETSSVRRQEEARGKRAAAGRKQDELALKDTVIRSRMHRLPLLASFLLTSDNVPANADQVIVNEDVNGDLIDSKNLSDGTRSILDAPPRGHPPPLFFLPAILLDSQRKFIERRKKEVEAALKAEWTEFREQRDSTTAEIAELRAQAQASQAEVNAEKKAKAEADADVQMDAADKDDASATIEKKGKSNDTARADDDADDVRMEDVDASKEGEDKVEY